MIHSDSSLVDAIIEHLSNNGGSAPATELVSDVMGLANCTPEMAVSLIRGGLPADGRLSVNGDGIVQLHKPDKDDPSIDDLEYVVVDIEATSLPAPSNRMTEFAAVLVEKGEIIGDYTTLVNPGIPIPRYVRQMTGITNEMVKEAPPFEELADEILEVLSDRVIVAHNSSFDVGLLNAEFQRAKGITLDNRNLCTVKMARKLQPGLDKYRLGNVAEYYGIEIEDRHRAYADAEATARILLHLLERARERGMTHWSHLAKIAGSPKSESEETSD